VVKGQKEGSTKGPAGHVRIAGGVRRAGGQAGPGGLIELLAAETFVGASSANHLVR
jgi:hypothetical protein